jgi:hypothetical protein
LELETVGTVQMRGDTDSAVPVTVQVSPDLLILLSGEETIGRWESSSLGIVALNSGFAIRVEGEEFLLRTDDDAGVADSLGLATASPRLARLVAASHPPEERAPEPEKAPIKSRLGSIAFTLAGVLVVAGGLVLRLASSATDEATRTAQAERFWLVFVVGGVLMAAGGYILSIGGRWSRLGAIGVLIALIVAFVIAVGSTTFGSGQFLGYGFVAGGLVVGAAVVFSGTLGGDE